MENTAGVQLHQRKVAFLNTSAKPSELPYCKQMLIAISKRLKYMQKVFLFGALHLYWLFRKSGERNAKNISFHQCTICYSHAGWQELAALWRAKFVLQNFLESVYLQIVVTKVPFFTIALKQAVFGCNYAGTV